MARSRASRGREVTRRSFLAGAGGAAASAFLAGCSGLPASSSGTTTSSGGTSSGGTTATQVPANSLFHYITTGQSLATGTQGTPALSTVQPFSNKMFTYPYSEDPDFLNNPVNFNAVTLGYNDIAFRTLVNGPSESGANGSVETIANGFADSLTAEVPAYQQLLSCSGVGGTAYAGLAGPTDYPPDGSPSFQEMMSQVRTGLALASAAGLSYTVPAMLVIHGEFDGYNADYTSNLKTWQSDTQNGVNAITGGKAVIPMIAAQTQAVPGAIGNFNTLPFLATGGPLGTLAAALANPSVIYVACPEYMMAHHYYEDAEGNPDPLGEPIHMTADGYRHLGLMMAKTAYAVCLQQGSWLPVMPVSIALRGNTIKVEYTVPHPPLAIDTSYVTDPGNYGFNYADSMGSTIVNVAVTGSTEVTVTLSAASPGGYISYALVDPGPAGGAPYGQGFGPTAGPRGCVRDSDPSVSYYKNSVTGQPYPMQNYSVIWQQAVSSAG